jgi:hypothetical protein
MACGKGNEAVAEQHRYEERVTRGVHPHTARGDGQRCPERKVR